jgi:protein kinase-like protein/schlafen family protein
VAVVEGEAVFADRYELRRLLGDGERKRVYHAWDRRLQRDVALALLHVATGEREAMETEVRTVARLGQHPNIVTLYDADWRDGQAYVVTEYMRGGDLTERCRRCWDGGHALPLPEALALADDLCLALAHVHHAGLVHSDVSPGNIWLDGSGRSLLGDFDHAVEAGTPTDAPSLDPGGKPFRAPETAAGEPIDERADLYGLGAVLRFALSADSGGPSPGIPTALGALLGRLVDPDPDRRPQTAIAVHAQIAAARGRETPRRLAGLLESGEGAQVEFKSSLRTPYGDMGNRTPKEARAVVERAIAKAVAAFLNSSTGGTLVVGVADDGTVLGLEPDIESIGWKPNRDGWELAFRDVIKKYLGADALAHVHLDYEEAEGRLVALVHVAPRPRETWLRDGGTDELYVRLANSSEPLSGRRLVSYVRERWPDRA